MATETKREEFGMTDKGQVVMITRQSYAADGITLVETYTVKHGVRTIGEYTAKGAAQTIARTIAGAVTA